MEPLTDQVAMAIENARLYKAVQTEIEERERAEATLKQRNSELALLNRIIATSGAYEEPEQILQMACRELASVLNISIVSAVLLSADYAEAQIVAEHALTSAPNYAQIMGQLTDSAVRQYLFSQPQPLNIPNVQSHPILSTLQKESAPFKLESLLFLPFVVEDKVTGGFVLQTNVTRNYSTSEINLGWGVACHIANLLDRKKWQEAHRQLEEQFYQVQRMDAVGRLAGSIAHDFNNLLTVILSYGDLLLRKLEDPAQRNAVTQIGKAGERAATLTNQLLSFTRNPIVTPQVLNLNECITDMDDILQRIVGEHIKLTTTLEADLWTVKFDRTQIEQIIVNLVMNACDAMPSGGQLTMETTNIILDSHQANQRFEPKPGEYVMLAIGDTGLGVKDDIRPLIYDPFFTTKEIGQGPGLGLATVLGIVKRYGGHAGFYSEAGAGTIFKTYLPRAYEGTAASANRTINDTIPTGTETILLTEDNAEVRKLACVILQEQGYTLLEAHNGVAALEIMKDQIDTIDLLLTDVIMPEMGGKILAEKASQLRPDLKILFMSGYTDSNIELRGLLDTNVTLLQKPFSSASLAQMVRTVLDR